MNSIYDEQLEYRLNNARAANATDLDTACPYNDQPVFSQFCKDFITDKVCN